MAELILLKAHPIGNLVRRTGHQQLGSHSFMVQSAHLAHREEYGIVPAKEAMERVSAVEKVTNLEDLIKEIVLENEAALEQLYDKTVQNVYSLAMRITGESSIAEEVVGDVYLQVWEQATSYSVERGSVIAWMMIITRSRSLDAWRRQARDRALPLDCVEQEPVTVEGAEDLLMQMNQCSEVRKALYQINATQRQLVALSFYRGYSHQQMSNFTGMPLGTVKSHLKRAMKVMRTLLTESGTLTGDIK